jgi:hypothetical protein
MSVRYSNNIIAFLCRGFTFKTSIRTHSNIHTRTALLVYARIARTKTQHTKTPRTKLIPAMLPPKEVLCILVLLPLTESCISPQPNPTLATAHADARKVEPEAVARALTEVVRINPISGAEGAGWLADLRGFDGPERQELSGLLRQEGVGLADRSKLRRLATAVTQSTIMEDDAFGIPRRAQQADRREESVTNKQQREHAGTAEPINARGDNSSGLSADSASPSLWHPLARRMQRLPLVRSRLEGPHTKSASSRHVAHRRRTPQQSHCWSPRSSGLWATWCEASP